MTGAYIIAAHAVIRVVMVRILRIYIVWTGDVRTAVVLPRRGSRSCVAGMCVWIYRRTICIAVVATIVVKVRYARMVYAVVRVLVYRVV